MHELLLEVDVAQVEADLEKAKAAGNEKKVKELEENLESRQSFLEMAKRASAEPTPLPSNARSTSVWVKTMSSSVSWYSAKPARASPRRAS